MTFFGRCFRCKKAKPDDRADWYCECCRRLVDQAARELERKAADKAKGKPPKRRKAKRR